MPILGLREFESALKKVAAEADAAARENVTKAAALVEAAAKGNFAGSHAKGEPRVNATVGGRPAPNVVTGTLRRSIRHDEVRRFGLAEYGTSAGPRAKYARRVELDYGYAFWGPAVEHTRPRFSALAAETWRRFLSL